MYMSEPDISYIKYIRNQKIKKLKGAKNWKVLKNKNEF